MISSQLPSASTAWGRRSPCVSEMSPITDARTARSESRSLYSPAISIDQKQEHNRSATDTHRWTPIVTVSIGVHPWLILLRCQESLNLLHGVVDLHLEGLLPQLHAGTARV